MKTKQFYKVSREMGIVIFPQRFTNVQKVTSLLFVLLKLHAKLRNTF